jgi:serine/threonine protein kinase
LTAEGALVAGRYRLDQPIGRGRAGIVWLAHDTMLNRTVAAKRMYIPSGLDHTAAVQMRANAVQEGREATKIANACVITVHDVVLDGVDPWLIMEFVPSRNMSDFLIEYGYLSADQAAFLGIQLATALSAAHSVRIMHRALEPGNVLLADDGGVKVTDFGLSAPPPDPAYLAPELAQGERPTPASDAFALGATLYAAVEGVPPFGEQGTGELRQPQLAGVLGPALTKLLRADPMNRPTLRDTVTSLQAINQGRQTAFIPPTAPALPTVPVAPPQWPAQLEKAPRATIKVPGQARAWIITALAIFVAIAVGIGISEVLMMF